MTKKQIDTLFSEKVMKYLNDGYVFFTNTMNVSHGDCEGCIDLYKNNQLIRIALITSREHFYSDEMLNISTFKKTFEHPLEKYRNSVWTSDMTLVEKEGFYKLSDTYFITAQEYIAQKDLRDAKLRTRANNYRFAHGSDKISFDDRAKKIVLSYVQRQPRCKSIKLSDIEEVIKWVRPIGHHDMKQEIRYDVRVRGKSSVFVLKQTYTKIH